MQRRTRDRYDMVTSGHAHHVNDAHDRCELIVWQDQEGPVLDFPETNPQRRRRIVEENRVMRAEGWYAFRRGDMVTTVRNERSWSVEWEGSSLTLPAGVTFVDERPLHGFKARNDVRSRKGAQ
jgi:hypothetical protein